MHPNTEALLRYFNTDPLPENLKGVADPFWALATDIANKLSGPEVTVCLRKLLEARECALRAAS